MYDLTLVTGMALLLSGVAAGFINTIAGGGSMLTLPALMLLGMPADVANATNRVGVMIQSVTGLQGFHKAGQLDTGAMVSIIIPTLFGSVAGAVLATWLPVEVLKPVLLGCMVAMALVMVLRPSVMSPSGEGVRSVTSHPASAVGLFLAGVYGGFLQAGVGFMLLAALAGGLRYDLVRANALKIVCTAAFTLIALGIFVWNDLVLWAPGLVLAAGCAIGAHFSVRFAVKASRKTLNWILFVMVLLVCSAAWLS